MKALALMLVLALFTACGSADSAPPDASRYRWQAEANFRRVAVELAQAASFLGSSELLASALGAGCEEGMRCEAEEVDPAARAEELAQWLSSRVFTEANYERTEGDALLYRLRPEVVCEAGDRGCVEALDAMPIRLRVTSDEPGDLDIAVFFGTDRLHLLDIALYRDSLEIQVELGAVAEALRILGLPAEILPEMEGRLGLGIARHDDRDFTVSLSILDPVSLRGGVDSAWHLELARALPAVAMRLDGAEQTVELHVGFGALDLLAPLASFLADDAEEPCLSGADCGEDAPIEIDGSLGLQLAGLTGSATLRAGAREEELRIRNLGFGSDTAVVHVDGQPVFTLDLNPLTGRMVELLFTRDGDGTLLEVAPGLDLSLRFSFGPLADLVELPAWALDERLQVRLEGDPPQVLLPGETAAETKRLEVRSGSLTLASKRLPSLRVDAGMCLVGPEREPGAHPFAGLEAAPCD